MAVPGSNAPTFAQVTRAGWGAQSVVRAIERCILMVSSTGTLPRSYDWNYQGITEALWDLGGMLQGNLSGSGIGPLPPGTTQQPPGSGNVVVKTPVDGTFWFDTRQGRLFVSLGGNWYQTNGAESFVHVGPTPLRNPQTGGWSERHGMLWLCTIDGRLYLYVDDPIALGQPGWYEVSGGGGGGGTGVVTPATVSSLGGVIVGQGLHVEPDGTLSITSPHDIIDNRLPVTTINVPVDIAIEKDAIGMRAMVLARTTTGQSMCVVQAKRFNGLFTHEVEAMQALGKTPPALSFVVSELATGEMVLSVETDQQLLELRGSYLWI